MFDGDSPNILYHHQLSIYEFNYRAIRRKYRRDAVFQIIREARPALAGNSTATIRVDTDREHSFLSVCLVEEMTTISTPCDCDNHCDDPKEAA